MEFKLVSSFDPENLSIFFLNGGGQTPFSPRHKFVRYVHDLIPNVNIFTVVLPGHGNHHLTYALNSREYVDLFYRDFKKLLQDHDIDGFALIGFSLGGLLSLKLVSNNFRKCVFAFVYGCGLHVSNLGFKKLEYFASHQFFDDMKWIPIMKKNHGSGWKLLIDTINQSFYPGTPLLVHPEKINDISIPTVILFGENEEIFIYEDTVKVANENPNLVIEKIPIASHFEYTTKAWEHFKIAFDNNLSFLMNNT